MIDVVVFDLDDTLYLERDFVKSGFRAVSGWLEAERGLAGFYESASAVFDAGGRGDVFDRALEQLGQSTEGGIIKELVEVYRTHEPALTLLEDAAALLPQVRKSHRLALITDGYADVQRRKVAALDLARQLDVIVLSDALGGRESWKPSPVPYEQIMASMACAGARCLYVGDNPLKDFVTAKRLGWSTVRIRREGGEHARIEVEPTHEAEHHVTSLADLPAILAEL